MFLAKEFLSFPPWRSNICYTPMTTRDEAVYTGTLRALTVAPMQGCLASKNLTPLSLKRFQISSEKHLLTSAFLQSVSMKLLGFNRTDCP